MPVSALTGCTQYPFVKSSLVFDPLLKQSGLIEHHVLATYTLTVCNTFVQRWVQSRRGRILSTSGFRLIWSVFPGSPLLLIDTGLQFSIDLIRTYLHQYFLFPRLYTILDFTHPPPTLSTTKQFMKIAPSMHSSPEGEVYLSSIVLVFVLALYRISLLRFALLSTLEPLYSLLTILFVTMHPFGSCQTSQCLWLRSSSFLLSILPRSRFT